MSIATTIEQSRHLLELGLDPSTADMYYPYLGSGMYGDIPRIGFPIEYSGGKDIPTWSFTALLELMPMVNEGWPVCCKIYNSGKWHVLYHSTAVTPKIDSGEYDTPIEAAYELVCRLLEQGLIKKEITNESN